MEKEERWHEIIDDKGVIFSGGYEELSVIFHKAKYGEDYDGKKADVDFTWEGDLKLVEVIDIHK